MLAAMAVLLPLGIWSLRQLQMQNDVSSWLPSDDPEAIALREFQDRFPSKPRFFVSWDGASLDDPRIEQLAMHLEGIPDSKGLRQGGSPYVESVLTPRELIGRIRKGVEFEDGLNRLDGLLIGRGPLRLELTKTGQARGRFLVDDLKRLAKQRLGVELGTIEPDDESSWVSATLPVLESTAEPQQELVDYLANRRTFDLSVQWAGMHATPDKVAEFIKIARSLNKSGEVKTEPDGELVTAGFFLQGSAAAVSIELSEAGVEDRAEAISQIREVAAGVGVAPDCVRIAGRMVAGAALNQAVKKAAWDTSFPLFNIVKRSPMLLSFIVTMVFSFILLRSIRLALLVMVISLYTVAISIAVVPATGGFMNMVLIVMPTLLMVLTTSAGIHLANYWRHAACEGSAANANQQAVIDAAKTAAKPCLLASFTTAVGLLSLCASSLVPVSDFGLYSAIGCGISLVVVLYGLPSLMMYWRSKPPTEAELKRDNWNTLGRFIHRFSVPIIIACLAAGGAATYGLRWFDTETKVIRYFPDDSRIVQDYRFIEDNLCGVVSVDTLVRFDAAGQQQLNMLQRQEVVRRIQNKIAEHPEISGVLSLATFQPVAQEQPKGRLQRIKYNGTAREMQKKIHRAIRQRYGGVSLDEAEDDAAEGESESQATSAITSLVSLDIGANDTAETVPTEIWRISAQVAIMSDLDYAVLMEDLDKIARSELKLIGSPGTDHQVTGLVPVFLRTQQAVLESLIRSFLIAFGVIAVVMMILLKDIWAGLITMIPNLLPVFAVFGLISYYGISIDIGTMITASVALGIAVDGTLHLLTWFKNRLEQGDTREEAVTRSLEHCGPAMLQTSAAIGLGMLTLLPVELLLISRFGWLMASLIAVALVADVILLPALLSSVLGSLIEKTVARSRDESEQMILNATTARVIGPDGPGGDLHQHRAG